MPPFVRGTRGRGVPVVNSADRGRGRGRGRGPRCQNDARNGTFGQNDGVGSNQDNQADQPMVLQQIMERLDIIEASIYIPSGGASFLVPPSI